MHITRIVDTIVSLLILGHLWLMYRGTDGVTFFSASESDVTRTDLATLGFVRRAAKDEDLAFGMATSLVRLSQSVDSIAHWTSDRGTLLVVVIEDYIGHEDEVADLLAQFHSLKINAIFIPPIASNHSMSQSHFAVLSKMLAESGPETKWFALLDDDTFFPHLEPLSTALSSLDHENKDLYVGGLTEDWGSLTRFGLMAYGGAGVYLSAYLARKIGNLD
ncbi:uncharacterized protein B0I36DRAFT_356353 [Microdochium trichocladiopsis]|uniref:Uncharacterized protein n=1 Tax=Microdochium trichocladiopsis TaxID=1682393 RepID=A0A9P8XTU1_9PEZI|nr:uncharacterized protein B0I36DRAFT_356353 [Microdochium trichocladiopsis]KAH7012283.1 hypothetical protein B0I36DRAFT_356353 [Microdochium trichocladiopsis]